MTRARRFVREHPVVTYVALACAVSWAYWIPLAARGEVVTPGGDVSHHPGLLGPLIAAFVVTAIADGRTGLRGLGARMARWRVPLRWYVVAATPFLMFVAAVALLEITGGPVPALGELGEFSGLPAIAFPLVVVLALVFNAFGEETGWRGFMTDRLLERRGPMTASLMVAAAWALWHVPSFFIIETYRNLGLVVIPMMGIGLVSGAIVLTWVYLGSGSSVLIVALWHLALNFASATAAGRGLPGMVVWIGIVLWAILVALRWMVADEPRTRPLLTRMRDGFLVGTLRSPLGRIMPGMTVIKYRGRVSGRTLMTPVECAYEPGHLFVLVSHPDRKQWWRNVRADPEVTVEIAGREVSGHATVHVGDDDGAVGDLAKYLELQPRVARALGLSTRGGIDRQALARAVERAVSVRIDVQLAR